MIPAFSVLFGRSLHLPHKDTHHLPAVPHASIQASWICGLLMYLQTPELRVGEKLETFSESFGPPWRNFTLN